MKNWAAKHLLVEYCLIALFMALICMALVGSLPLILIAIAVLALLAVVLRLSDGRPSSPPRLPSPLDPGPVS